MPNEIVDKALALKRFLPSHNKECKVVISALAMRVDSSKNGFSPEGKLNFERIKYTTCRKLQRRALTFQKKFICFIESPFKMK